MDLKSQLVRITKLTEQLQKEHSDAVFLSSIENPATGKPAGQVCMAPPRLAAQCIVLGTHKVAEPVEVEQFHTDQKLRARIYQAENDRHRPPRLTMTITETAVVPTYHEVA